MSVPDLERLLGPPDETAAAANDSRSGLNGLIRRLFTLLQGLTVTVNASDIELGAVELKNAADDTRAKVAASGSVAEGDSVLAVQAPVLGATSDAAVTTDTTGSLSGKLRGLIKIFADIWDSTNHRLRTYASAYASAPLAYRSAAVAADTLAVPGALTTSAVAGGSLPNATYKNKVVAVNAYGRTTASAGADVATSGGNNSVRIAFAQVTGATHYDIYLSTDTDPKWVGRISEAQRATGILITAVGTTGAGGTAGAVDVQAAGTGLQPAASAAQNMAYVVPPTGITDIDTTGYQFVDFLLSWSRTGDAVASGLTVIPFFKNTRTNTYQQGEPRTLSFGGVAGAVNSNQQRLRVETRGCPAMALVVGSISGTGGSVDVDYVLS